MSNPLPSFGPNFWRILAQSLSNPNNTSKSLSLPNTPLQTLLNWETLKTFLSFNVNVIEQHNRIYL